MMKYGISAAMVIAATGNASALCLATTPQGEYACQQQTIQQNQQILWHNQQQMRQYGGGAQLQPLNQHTPFKIPQIRF